MHGSITIVDQLVQVPVRETPALFYAPVVTGIGVGGGKPILQCPLTGAPTAGTFRWGACQASVAVHKEPAVPIRWQIHREAYLAGYHTGNGTEFHGAGLE